MNDEALVFERVVAAPAAEVYRAFTNGLHLTEWLCDGAQVNASVGGLIVQWWNLNNYGMVGQFEALTENELIRYSWLGQGEPGPSTVEVKLKATGSDSTTITLTHRGLGSDAAWEQTRVQVSAGWESSLDNLKRVMETGIDSRQFDRPMLGVFVNGPVTPEQVKELGMPVSHGIQIGGTIAGMGAEAAGLQNNDVLTALNGHKLETFQSFGPALAGKKGGDPIAVEYYRGGEKHTVTMNLGKMPIPETPATPAGLAAAMRETFVTLNEELDALFDGVSEEIASARPAENEWSAKENLAHLIINERWRQYEIALTAGGDQTGGYVNDHGHTSAVADSQPLAELIETLKREQAVTATTMERLPANVAARKMSYVWLAQAMQQFAPHHRQHFAQAQAAMEMVRERAVAG